MNKSKAPLVMLEQMVMLLVFALAAALCLQAFVLSDASSRKSEARDRAANLCQSMAEVMRTNGGSAPEAATTILGDGWQCETGLFIVPLNEDMTAYTAGGFPYEGAPYRLETFASETVLNAQIPGLDGAEIVVRAADGEELFSLEVLWQVEVTQ